jgi:hypothetical protein
MEMTQHMVNMFLQVGEKALGKLDRKMHTTYTEGAGKILV